MRKILVSQRIIDNESYVERRDALDVRWGSFFRQLGALPILVPSRSDLQQYFSALQVDGVLLTGGNDLFQFSKAAIDKERDVLEEQLVNAALASNVPIIGVCRGMQFLTSFFGGELVKVEDHVATEHELVVNDENPYASSLSQNLVVNSFHSYAPNDTPPQCVELARADDGVLEAFSHSQKAVLAMMWHPERSDSFASRDIELFRQFYSI